MLLSNITNFSSKIYQVEAKPRDQEEAIPLLLLGFHNDSSLRPPHPCLIRLEIP